MLKNVVITLVTLILIGLPISQALAQSPNGGGNGRDNRNPVRICHATDSHSNPYTNPTVDQDSVDGDLGNDNGQGDHYMEHNGPVWFDGIEDHSWGDIIPPIAGVHEGKNWNPQGQAFWNNNCNIPGQASPSPEVSPSPSPEISPSPSPEVSPNPSVEPSSSPNPSDTPTVRHGVSFHNGDLVCDTDTFRAVFDAYNYGSPVSNMVVRFTFHGETKEDTTDSNGRAEVTFPLKEGIVTATADGYGTHTHEITPPAECKDAYIDPNRGQVLGATTLADTGSASLLIAQALMAGGALLTAAGAVGLRKVL